MAVDFDSRNDQRGRHASSDNEDSEKPRLQSTAVVVTAADSPVRQEDGNDSGIRSKKKSSTCVSGDPERPRESSLDSLPEVDDVNATPRRKEKVKDDFRDSRSTQSYCSTSPSPGRDRNRSSHYRNDNRPRSHSRHRHSSSSSSASSKSRRSENHHSAHHSSSSKSKHAENEDVFKKPSSPSRGKPSSGSSRRGSDKNSSSGRKSPPSRLGIDSETNKSAVSKSSGSRDTNNAERHGDDRLSLASAAFSAVDEVDELEATSVVRDILKMFDDLKTTIRRAKSPSNLEEGEVLDEQELRVQEAKLREVENLSLDEMLMRIVAHVDEQDQSGEEENGEVMSPVSGDDAAEPGEITADDEQQEERYRKKQAERASREASRQTSVEIRSGTSHRSARRKSPKHREPTEGDDDVIMQPDEEERERMRHAFKAASPSAILQDALADVESIMRPGGKRDREETFDSDALLFIPDDDRRARHTSSSSTLRRSPSAAVTFRRTVSNYGLGYNKDEDDRDDADRSRRDDTFLSSSTLRNQTVEKDGDFWSRLDTDDVGRYNRRYGAQFNADEYERGYSGDADDQHRRSIDFRAPSYAASMKSSRSIRSEAHIVDNRDREDSQMTHRHSSKHREDNDDVDKHSHRSGKHSKVGSKRSVHSPAGSAGEMAGEREGDESRFSPSGRLRGIRSDSGERRKRRAEEKRGKGLRSMSADTLNSIFIDRRKLREVAIKNAVEMRKRGLIPLYCPRIPGKIEKQLARVKLKELTVLCRDIAAGRKPKKQFGDIKHPFQMSEKTLAINPHNTIDVNVRFALPTDENAIVTPTSTAKALPAAGTLGTLTTVTSRVTRDLRLAFPVSTGVQHRNVEVWFPQFQEEKQEHEQKEKDRELRKKARENKEAKDAATAASTGEIEQTANDKVLSAKALAKIVSPDLPNDLTRDYNSLVFQRLRFQKELQENPENTDAQSAMNRTQQLMMDWAVNYHGGSSNYLTSMMGEHAGSFGNNQQAAMDSAYGNPYGPDFISPAAMGPQAWATSDQLIRAKPLIEGIGIKLLQKMGWSPGVGIGKRQRGMLEPLRFVVKLNRRGLSTAQDYLKHQQHSQNALKQQLGKSVARCVIMSTHPCSALNEFCTKRGFGTPVFQEADDSGCAGDNPLYSSFMFQVIINGVAYKPPHRTRNKKEAKKICAEHALETLGVSYRGQNN